MMARSLLLALHRAGHITLPPVRHQPPNNAIARCRPAPVAVDTDPLERGLGEVQPLELLAVRRTPQEGLYDGLIAQYHYLGPAHGVGEQVKYLAFSQGRPLACLGFSCAPGTWVRATASSAGRRRYAAPGCICWATTPAS